MSGLIGYLGLLLGFNSPQGDPYWSNVVLLVDASSRPAGRETDRY